MARIPDRFDLFVRQARACADPARQVDLVLGALVALPAWYFLGHGAGQDAYVPVVEMEETRIDMMFTDAGRAEEMKQAAPSEVGEMMSVVGLEMPGAIEWCLKRKAALLVNPGDDAALIPFDQLEAFHSQWMERGAGKGAGFWIPNMTSAEEDFWQEHGL